MLTDQRLSSANNNRIIRVLLVEDNESDSFLLENLLYEIQDLEFEIHCAQRLQEAKNILAASSFDVVLLDLSLPDSSGLESLCTVLEVTDTSVVVLTGSADNSLRNKAIRQGAQDYLPKTDLESEVLRRTIEYSIERQRLSLELKEKLEELRASESRTKRMFDQSFDGIAVIDSSGKFLYLNPAAEELFGRSRQLLLGKPFGQEISETTIEIPNAADAGSATVELRKRSIEWEQDRAWLVILRDISDRVELEEKLRQSQKLEAIGRLAGGVAHDFNNQLTAIMGFTELAIRTSDAEKAMNHLNHVRKATEKSAALTSQLLTFGRKQVLKPEAIILNDLLLEIEKMLERVIRKDIDISFSKASDLGYAYVDPTQIDQVVMNLVINSSDAMPNGGQISIETSNVELDESDLQDHPELAPGAYVELVVTDSGEGMDKKTLSRIFEPFFSTKEIGEGTGLGLATVYGIITQSNGYILVTSDPGAGTSFRIRLPRTDHKPTQARAELESDMLQQMPTSILLVEDDEEILELFKIALEMENTKVICAVNGIEALEKMQQLDHPVEMLLTDLIMPRMGGEELANRIAMEHPETCIVFMSGYTRETVLQRGFLPPGVNLIQKPISPYSLIRCIKQIMITEKGAD